MNTQVETATAVATESPVAAAQPARPTGPWIYSAWLDLLVGCGGWSAPLLLVAALLTSAHTHAWSVLFYALAIVFNYPHFMATEYRAYRTREDFRKYKFFTLHLTLLLVLTGVLAHAMPRLVPWIFTLYICWSPWHYTGQNYGLLLMFVRRSGAAIEAGERRWLRAAFVASYAMLLASFQTAGSNDPLILSVGLPGRFTVPARAVLGFAFAVCAFGAFHGLLKRSGWRAMVAPLTLLVTQFLWFVLPTLIELWSPYQIPQTRYSSGILAVLHSTQYLWITSYYQKREARAAGQTRWRIGTYWIALVAGGIALFIPGPWLVSYIFRFDFTTSFLIFTALVNIHHFMLDGAIWKLRDSRVASRLIGQPAGEQSEKAASRAPAKTGPARADRKDTSAPLQQPVPQSWAPRVFAVPAFRIAVVAILFLWGGTDQVRFALGTDEGNLAALSGAARMNPYDGAVEQRIGYAQIVAGKPEDAIKALSRAVAVNPYDEESQQELARAMIQAGHYGDAYAHYQEMLALFPHDADALLNYGVLASQLGHLDEAMSAWQRSLAVDPAEINAHVYLANAFDQRRDYASAAAHWYAYLQLATAQRLEPGANTERLQIAPSDEIGALLRFSDDETQLSDAAAAITGYSSAASLAQRGGNTKLESLADARLADVEEKAGDAKSAATLYQKALALDAKIADPASGASDWFNYAQFLQRHDRRADLVYASLLQAESLFGSAGGEHIQTVQMALQAVEKQLGAQASAAKKNQETLRAAAASLSPNSF